MKELTPSYMEFIGGVMEKYAKMGITSWRLDVADELPDGFIEFLRKKLKAIGSNVHIEAARRLGYHLEVEGA